ncbi:hypothetical protein TKK_0017553 [Trichogramma kaykai]|uniref:Nose resistant-to-fluoxetine protein N-terminal domain-containing protein n=1 Tax=Trichogramma kaykai TaxID=54128 RepID=A0ABD2W3C4_9HYME
MLILNCIWAISLVLVLNANESLGHLSPFHRVAGLDRRAHERNRTERGYLKLTDVRTAESCDERTESCRTTLNTYVNYVESDLRDFPRERSPFEKIWLEKIPLPPIAVAESRSTPKGACRRQLSRYFQDLRDGKLWAVQMFDASAKYPYGIIDGQTRHLGSFDQCYRVDTWLAPATKYERLPERVRGRYCLVDFEYKQKRDRPRGRNGQKLGFDFNPKGSAWEAVKEKGDFRRVRRYNVQMALCVPAACSPAEVSQALSAPYDDFAAQNDLSIRVRIDEHNCQTQAEEPRVSRGTLVYGLVLGGIVVTVVISSIYDGTLETQEEREGSSNAQKLLLCFSARRNLRTVFEVSYKHRGLDTIHFLRFVSMCMVLIGHRMMQYYFNPVVNKRYLEMTFDVPSFVIVHNGPIIVDGFFAIGGLLTCYGLLDQFDKTKRMNFIGLTFIRFLRFTPAYALMIFFVAYVFPHLGSGPEWAQKVVAESQHCASTWWANLFYLNNYLTMDRMCIFQSWYLSVDFHCYLVAIVLIYLFWKWPRKIGYSILGLVTLLSIVVPFYITYKHRIQPLFIGFPHLNGLADDSYFLNYYVKTHLRMSAYLIGVIAGAILYDYQRASWRISKDYSKTLFFVLVLVMSYYSQSYGFRFYDPNVSHSSLEMAVYASLHRATFAVSFCSIILLIEMSDGLNGYYKFLTPGWCQPLGRLTYSVFLSHGVIQTYQMATVRTARTFSINSTLWDFVPDVVYSFSLALLIAIGIEGPFRKMEKHFIMRRTTKRSDRSTFRDESPAYSIPEQCSETKDVF